MTEVKVGEGYVSGEALKLFLTWEKVNILFNSNILLNMTGKG